MQAVLHTEVMPWEMGHNIRNVKVCAICSESALVANLEGEGQIGELSTQTFCASKKGY